MDYMRVCGPFTMNPAKSNVKGLTTSVYRMDIGNFMMKRESCNKRERSKKDWSMVCGSFTIPGPWNMRGNFTRGKRLGNGIDTIQKGNGDPLNTVQISSLSADML
jgi:hypothetical protein